MKVLLEALARYPNLDTKAVRDLDSLDGGRRAARALLRTYSKLTAIICVNDIMAVGALRELRECGIQVPRDVSVTGHRQHSLGSVLPTPVDISAYSPGHDRADVWDCLVKAENASFHQEFEIDIELVVRDSTAPAATRRARK